MSVITGLWLKDGAKIDRNALSILGERSERYAPDGTTTLVRESLWMMSQALHTHERSFSDKGIASDPGGNVVALDGRIDNYEDLCRQLDLNPQSTSDSALILAGYRKWGHDLPRRLVGDWSLSLWDELKRTLCLARDHAGTRTLYYSDTAKFTMWSTFPEPLLAYTGVQELDREYMRRYLAAAPTKDLTPYVGIKSVPAACYLLIRQAGEVRCVEHWSPLVKRKLHYQRDEDYQEEFLSLFGLAVKRRTDGVGVFAHLSGGVDSSSIVCVADLVNAREGKSPSLQTMSFFDDQEPDWDERPFFTAVEKHRGIRGTHVHASAAVHDFSQPREFHPFPGVDNAAYERERYFVSLAGLSSCRAVLAGYGGDELLGGPPDPRPELADSLVSMSFGKFFHSSFAWALSKRVPLFAIATAAVRFAITCYPRVPVPRAAYPPWLSMRTEREQHPRHHAAQAYTIGYSPSAVGSAADWRRLLETLPHRNHGHFARYEYRYPYLDRDLVDFLLQVPASQLVRPGRRRFMMRAGLHNIVPDVVLERKRKAFVSRGPHLVFQTHKDRMSEIVSNGLLSRIGVVDIAKTMQPWKNVLGGGTDHMVPLLRLIELELWIGQALSQGVVDDSVPIVA